MLMKPIAASASGVNQIVAGTAATVIRVFGWHWSFSGTVNAKWQTGSSSPADVTGLTYGAADTNTTAPPLPVGFAGKQQPYFVTNKGDDLSLNLSGATAVGGWVLYDQVTL